MSGRVEGMKCNGQPGDEYLGWQSERATRHVTGGRRDAGEPRALGWWRQQLDAPGSPAWRHTALRSAQDEYERLLQDGERWLAFAAYQRLLDLEAGR